MPEIKPRIVPHLWFDKEAREAADLYASVFPHSRVGGGAVLHDTPSGDAHLVSFELWDQPFMAISAGPEFKFNPSVSFMVNYDPTFFAPSPTPEQDARAALDQAWETLSVGGQVLMPLDAYPFSPHYGWVQDKYGLSWQLMLTNPAGDPRPPIIPALLFVGRNCGRAEEALRTYLAVFPHSRLGNLLRYGADHAPDKPGTVMFADCQLGNLWLVAMDSAYPHAFQFNEALSFMVQCDDQAEIDYYWGRLSAVPEAEQCGWLKDQFGLSWQIVPTAMSAMMSSGTPEQVARLTQAFLPMKKLDIAVLRRAYEGR
jgi:predicted 3-demethylubiquinone-9 3-methyltransferase (glyoxalase superfamily)